MFNLPVILAVYHMTVYHTCQEALEMERSQEGLRVNAGKTKVMIYGTGLDLLQSPQKLHLVMLQGG